MRQNRKFSDHHLKISQLEAIFGRMKAEIFPNGTSDGNFKKYLYAVQHVERYPATDTKVGRRPRFERNKLVNDALKFKAIMVEETKDRISLLHFITNYLSLLNYPNDVKTAYDKQQINLEEARILARINQKNFGSKVNRRAVDIRKELLESHLKRSGTQTELRRRVDEKINFTPKAQAVAITAQISNLNQKFDELLEFDEFDTEHLLWEEIKSLVFLSREIDVSQIGEDEMKGILKLSGQLSDELHKYKPKIVKVIKF